MPRDALRPPSSDSARVGVSMSLLAHAALIAALTLGVRWRANEPAGVDVELWAATPQRAEPRAEPAPPTPLPAPETRPQQSARVTAPAPEAAQLEADIATERAAHERKDRERREAAEQLAREQGELARRDKDQALRKKLQQQLEASRKQAELDKMADAQRDKLHDEQMRRINAQLGGSSTSGNPGTAAKDAGPSASYGGRIKARVKPNIVLTDEVPGNPMTEVEVRVAPDGTILGRRVLTPSGVKAWDEAVLRAIDRTGLLPRDTDGRVPATMIISFKPLE